MLAYVSRFEPSVQEAATRVDLLPSIAAGDREAVAACVDRYGALLFGMALRMCANRSDAEDAVQEAFLELWRFAGRFDPTRASEKTFVMMVARRRLIDRRRADARNIVRAVPEAALNRIPADDHVRMELSSEARLAERALATLPDERQRVLRMSIYDGLTHDQIAEETKIPLGTVKSHVRRGLQAVRDLVLDSRQTARRTEK